MEYKIIDQNIVNGVKTIEVDLPLDIANDGEETMYYDNELRSEKKIPANYWVVDSCDCTPKGMKVQMKGFKTPGQAVEYGRQLYLKYLREELKKVRHGDDEQIGRKCCKD